MNDWYDQRLLAIQELSIARLQDRLASDSPKLCRIMEEWVSRLAPAGSLAKYFTSLRAFPVMLLPWWIEASLTGGHDERFQEDLAYSCLCGYLSIRLMDNVMDELQSQERHILPLTGFFHHEFQSAYLDYFPPGDDFWGFFRRTWLQSIEVTILDAGGESNDLVSFLEVAAKKTCAAKIPLFAVCRHSGLQSVPEPWLQIFDGLAAFHQMFNDLIDFQRDHDALSPTFFLSVAEKRREGNETVLGWVLREGFDWGYGELKGMIERLVRDAQACCSSDLSHYLELRKRDLDTLRQDMTGGIEAIRSILKAKP